MNEIEWPRCEVFERFEKTDNMLERAQAGDHEKWGRMKEAMKNLKPEEYFGQYYGIQRKES